MPWRTNKPKQRRLIGKCRWCDWTGWVRNLLDHVEEAHGDNPDALATLDKIDDLHAQEDEEED